MTSVVVLAGGPVKDEPHLWFTRQYYKFFYGENYLWGKYKPLKKIKSVRRGNFQINVAPDDTALKKSVIKIKAKHIQSTFSIEKKNI